MTKEHPHYGFLCGCAVWVVVVGSGIYLFGWNLLHVTIANIAAIVLMLRPAAKRDTELWWGRG